MCGQLHQKANSIMKKRLSFEEVTLLFSEPFVTKSSITKRSLNRRWSCMLVVRALKFFQEGRDSFCDQWEAVTKKNPLISNSRLCSG
ncbi:uncharacterized protein LOC114320255 isoform X2 [Camellia sinensis]|uniref:uncharacterized protein LOC114320255 isoform X2 n=1 Tax=Camellia sinensis TaxID=4442 RepID=UPI0010369C64|nr:uncharacterized protein LOC114320255 isoform X2 [Camellia sinensis]